MYIYISSFVSAVPVAGQPVEYSSAFMITLTVEPLTNSTIVPLTDCISIFTGDLHKLLTCFLDTILETS